MKAGTASDVDDGTRHGDSLRFVSDGVLEAQDAAGNLLGFERTQELGRERAQQIAKAAQEFGQKDDITVVWVDFLGGSSFGGLSG